MIKLKDIITEISTDLVLISLQRLIQELRKNDIFIIHQTIQRSENQIDFAVLANVHPASEDFLIKQIYTIVSDYTHIITMKKSREFPNVYLLATSFY